MSIRSKTKERNKEILERYNAGESVDNMASEYGLSDKTITYIVSKAKEREFNRDERLDDDAKTKRLLSRLRKIRIGDVLRIKHNSFKENGTRSQNVFVGTVVYKNNHLITVRGDYYTESFQLIDLIDMLVDHIPS